MKKIDLSLSYPIWENHSNIQFVFIFGSASDGYVKPQSDLDFGIYFDAQPTLDELTSLSSELQNVFFIDNIDIVDLKNSSNVVLKFEAIRGRVLFSKDPLKMAEFKSLIAREYEDEMAMLSQALKN